MMSKAIQRLREEISLAGVFRIVEFISSKVTNVELLTLQQKQ